MDISTINQNFYDLCKDFNLSDPNILRRFVHGLDTANCCFSLASSKYYDEKDRVFIYTVGLLHDIGRMIQWKKYANFSDTKTRPHELLGVEYLEKNWIKRFFKTKPEQNLALKLIAHHTEPYNGKDEKMNKFMPILRDSDCYSNLQYTSTGLQRLWLNADGVTPAVLAKFRLRQNLHGTVIHTKLDRILQFLSRTYVIEHNILKRDLLARKYINTIYDVYHSNLNEEDDKLLYKECWTLKRDLAEEVTKHDEIKKLAEEGIKKD